jgi:hypothetical protein
MFWIKAFQLGFADWFGGLNFVCQAVLLPLAPPLAPFRCIPQWMSPCPHGKAPGLMIVAGNQEIPAPHRPARKSVLGRSLAPPLFCRGNGVRTPPAHKFRLTRRFAPPSFANHGELRPTGENRAMGERMKDETKG